MGPFLVKLFVAMLGLVLLIGMVLFLVIYTVWAALRWLVTGQKPQVAVVWQQYSTLRRNFRQKSPTSASANRFDSDENVVDVEVRELKEPDKRLPPAKE